MTELGINLSFALKRWPEPERWAAIVAERLGLRSIQFTLDLIDAWWPQAERSALARSARAAAEAHEIALHSAQIGLAGYTYNGLLHPEPSARSIARDWWGRSIELAAELGAGAAGGPLGALSAADAADAARRDALYAELLEHIHDLADRAKREGLSSLLVEPTPLPREIPSTIAETERLLADCAGTAVPLRLVIDVGHALYRPLYGEGVTLEQWLRPLAPHVGVLHLQNHDFRSDAHWGWPDARGSYEPQLLARDAAGCGLAGVPVFIELFFPFEQDDDEVLALVESSVAVCRDAIAAT
jgi:D-erythrulose 1-phosphate 3-epimerase